MIAGAIGGFIKAAGALSITNVDPEQGPVEGGQAVTIYGEFSQNPIGSRYRLEAVTPVL